MIKDLLKERKELLVIGTTRGFSCLDLLKEEIDELEYHQKNKTCCSKGRLEILGYIASRGILEDIFLHKPGKYISQYVPIYLVNDDDNFKKIRIIIEEIK